jgi:hypothetical protein
VSVAFQVRFTRYTLSLSETPLSTFWQGASLRSTCDGAAPFTVARPCLALRQESAVAAIARVTRLAGLAASSGVPGMLSLP